MNKYIKLTYKWVLRDGGTVKVERIKNGVYGLTLYKDMPGEFYSGTKPWSDRRFFYLYPRNKYTGNFDE
jgi:hypothetical protein